MRSLFDSLDGFDQLAGQFDELTRAIQRTAAATHEMLVLIPPMITTMKTTKALTLTMQATFSAMLDQMESLSNTAVVMGQSFDQSKNDDFFYLPPEACSCRLAVVSIESRVKPKVKTSRKGEKGNGNDRAEPALPGLPDDLRERRESIIALFPSTCAPGQA